MPELLILGFTSVVITIFLVLMVQSSVDRYVAMENRMVFDRLTRHACNIDGRCYSLGTYIVKHRIVSRVSVDANTLRNIVIDISVPVGWNFFNREECEITSQITAMIAAERSTAAKGKR